MSLSLYPNSASANTTHINNEKFLSSKEPPNQLELGLLTLASCWCLLLKSNAKWIYLVLMGFGGIVGVWPGIVARRCAWKRIFLAPAFQNMAFMCFGNCVTALKELFEEKKAPKNKNFEKISCEPWDTPKSVKTSCLSGSRKTPRSGLGGEAASGNL